MLRNGMEAGGQTEDNHKENVRPASTIHDFEMYTAALEELVNHMPVVAFVREAREGGKVEFISDNISKFGYSAKDFLAGKIAYEDIIDPEDAAGALLELKENATEGAYEFTQNYRIRTGKGLIRWVEENTFIFRDGEGRPLYYTGTLKEIGER